MGPDCLKDRETGIDEYTRIIVPRGEMGDVRVRKQTALAEALPKPEATRIIE